MYLPQVWCLGHDTKARFPLHTAVKHRQREDIHLHLVLVLHTGHHVVRPVGVQSDDHLRTDNTTEAAAPVDEIAAHRDLPECQQEGRPWRLVDTLYPVDQHGFAPLQGFPYGVHEENG